MLGDFRDIINRLVGGSIEVRFELEPGLLSVNLDKTQTEQVLMNLVVNARDAMPDGGVMTIATSNVDTLPESITATTPSEKGYVRLTVSDNGSGMTEEQIEKIFDPFYSTKEVGEGTGLGLSTVYGIITQSDGYVAVQSSPGEGASFEMYFRGVDESPENQSSETDSIAESESEKILIVEDEPALREVLYELLLECGYTVESAALGQEALDIFSSKLDYFDLVITDVIMPGMGGPELVEAMRKLRPNIKVIFSSGYTADTIGDQGVLEQDQNFLAKPYRYEVLQSLVQKVLAED